MILRNDYDSPLGVLTLVSDGMSLTELRLPTAPAGDQLSGDNATQTSVFTAVARWLDEYFAGKNPDPSSLPLEASGTPFRERVWEELQKIPYGTVTSYGALAKKVSSSSRAVGGAIGHNPIPIIIPCHRVIGAGGNLTGFSGGMEAKIFLLEREGIACSEDRHSLK